MLFYYIFPISILVISFILYNIKISEKKIVILDVCILILFASIRANSVGSDLNNYENIFTDIFRHSWAEVPYMAKIHNVELMFAYFNKFVSLFTSNVQIYISFLAIIIYSAFGAFFIKYSKMPWLSMVLFVLYGTYFHTYNIMRQYLATVFFLCALDSLLEKKKLKYIISIILASCIHKSAICCLIGYVLFYIKPKRKHYIMLTSLILVLMLAGDKFVNWVLSFVYKDYFGTLGKASVDRGGMALFLFFTYVVMAIIVDLYSLKDGKNEIFLVILGISAAFASLSLTSRVVSRCLYYFDWIIAVLIPNVVGAISWKKTGIIKAFAYIIAILFFFIWLEYFMLSADADRIVPYNYFWKTIIS